MKSSQNESHFLDMTALQIAKPIFSPSTYTEYLFSHTLTKLSITEPLIFENLVDENVYFTIFPPK